MIADLVQVWEGLCHQYNKAYWAALHALVQELVGEVCKDQKEVAELAT